MPSGKSKKQNQKKPRFLLAEFGFIMTALDPQNGYTFITELTGNQIFSEIKQR